MARKFCFGKPPQNESLTKHAMIVWLAVPVVTFLEGMMAEPKHAVFNKTSTINRQVAELVGIARGIVSDGEVKVTEAEFLQRWIVATEAVMDNPVVKLLADRVNAALADGDLSSEESKDLFSFLTAFTGNDFEIGELLKSTSLPLNDPAPAVSFAGKAFCFTGTFVFGQRRACEAAVAERKGFFGDLVQKTNFLVIGEYATDSWANSSYGRKIEKAVSMREAGLPIAIISEAHWRAAL